MSVEVTDEGFRYGRGVFETLRVHDGQPLFRFWHEELIVEGARALALDPAPVFFISDPPDVNGIWRWYLTSSGVETHFETERAELPSSYTLSSSGIRIHSCSWESRYKTLNYLNRVQAREEASTDEVVLLNENGLLASAAMANLFWVRQGRIYTPATEAGCRAGVVRRWILEMSGEKVETGLFHPSELGEATEIFLTNSRVGIMPITAWCGKSLPLGDMTLALWKKYQNETRL
ncbi:MAG: aminotransferase class IV [Candidatus Methylacidiphilales bacterium]